MRFYDLWLRQSAYVIFAAGVIFLAIPSQAVSQVSRQVDRTLFGPVSLTDRQIVEVLTSWREGDQRVPHVFRLWDTKMNLLAERTVSSSPLSGRLTFDLRKTFPGTERLDVIATVDIEQGKGAPQAGRPERPSLSLQTYDRSTGRTDSLSSNEPWVRLPSHRWHQVIQSCPLGLNGNTMVQVTLVNTHVRPIRAQLQLLDPVNRQALASLTTERELPAVVPAGDSVRLRLDGTNDLGLVFGERQTVVVVSQTRTRDTGPPLVSFQLVEKVSGRTIYSGSNANLILSSEAVK